jgi:uncharacterized surface protein with fasciclin (FAS1) repeats
MNALKQFLYRYFLVAFAAFGIGSAHAYDVNRGVAGYMEDDLRLATLWKAIQKAGLEEALKGEGPFTIFAPDNLAFEQLGRGTFEDLLKDKDKLAKVLKYHVIPGKSIELSKQTAGKEVYKTLEGQDVALTKPKTKRFFANKAQVIEKDEIVVNNGVVHIINRVLLPPTGV